MNELQPHAELDAPRPAEPPVPREYGLLPVRPSPVMPLLTGLLGGLLLTQQLEPLLPRWLAVGLGALSAIAIYTGFVRLAWRRVPDRLRVDDDAVRLLRGGRPVRALDLRRLREVQQLDTGGGPVLLLSDRRATVSIPAGRLANPADYERLSRRIVEAVAAIDPTGELGRTAVQSGRRRLAMWQQPVRATWLLSLALAAGSLLGAAGTVAVAGRPFPLEALGAFSAPLVAAGEWWRLASWPFLHAEVTWLVVDVWALVWIGSYLEKLLGWERLLVAFAAGAIAGAAALLPLGTPLAHTGAGGAIFGLVGLLLAVFLSRRGRTARALLPMPGGWFVAAALIAALGLVLPRLPLLALSPALLLAALAPAVGGLLGGALAGLLFLPGLDLPAPPEQRRVLMPFGVMAALALAIGLAGLAVHPRLAHEDDDERVAQALLALPPTPEHAVLQNDLAYLMLVAPQSGPASIDIAERLATRAVELTARQEASILDTLAVARYRQNDPGEARALLEEALKLPGGQALKPLLEKRLKEIDAGLPLSPQP